MLSQILKCSCVFTGGFEEDGAGFEADRSGEVVWTCCWAGAFDWPKAEFDTVRIAEVVDDLVYLGRLEKSGDSVHPRLAMGKVAIGSNRWWPVASCVNVRERVRIKSLENSFEFVGILHGQNPTRGEIGRGLEGTEFSFGGEVGELADLGEADLFEFSGEEILFVAEFECAAFPADHELAEEGFVPRLGEEGAQPWIFNGRGGRGGGWR